MDKLKMYPKTKTDVSAVEEAGWCDAEYCEDPYKCKLSHYHVFNCRCEDCCANFDDICGD